MSGHIKIHTSNCYNFEIKIRNKMKVYETNSFPSYKLLKSKSRIRKIDFDEVIRKVELVAISLESNVKQVFREEKEKPVKNVMWIVLAFTSTESRYRCASLFAVDTS
jgi:hypothetical protein